MERKQIIYIIDKILKADIVIPETVVRKEMGHQTINVFDTLAANKWRIFTSENKPDVEKTKQIQNSRKEMYSKLLFRVTIQALRKYELEEEWNAMYKGGSPEETVGWEILLDYSIGALYFMDIIDPAEKEVSEPALDESKLLIGMKQMPREDEEEMEIEGYS